MAYGIMDIWKNMLGRGSHSERLRKREFWALDDVCFEVKKGETIGVIGPNGSGKTTMLKLLNGIFWPDKGKITVKGRVGVLIEIGAGFHPLMTGRENIFVNAAILGMGRKEVNEKLDSMIEFADIGDFIDVPVKYYSSGMLVRLGFAIAIHGEPSNLLVDEVLAVGDENFQNKCFNKIGEHRKKGGTTILVSHNIHIISTFAERVILLNHGKAQYFSHVMDGIKKYMNLSMSKGALGIEKICSGNDHIRFDNIEINKRIFKPGDSFSISLNYHSIIHYHEVEVDIGILSSNESSVFFQATNKAYHKILDLPQNDHQLKIDIENIPIHNAIAKIAIAIWSKNRTELLFWWRIPVEFEGVQYSTGKNFLNVTYEVSEWV